MSIKVTETFAQWVVAANYDEFPDIVKSKAADVLFDGIGAMVACSDLPEVKAITRLIEKLGGNPQSTIIGQSFQTSVVSASMVNGCMAHGAEADAVHLKSAGGHVAAGVVPTALSVGEWLNKSGKEVLKAIILGYEFGGRVMPIFYRERNPVIRRFYPTAVIGALSSAITACSLLSLNREQVQIALCLAAYQAAGPDNMIKDAVHMGKTFQAGCANRNGVTAALLAADGCTAPMDILEDSHSFFDAFLGAPDGGNEIIDELGHYYSITDVMHKRFPVGSPNQTYLQALATLIDKYHPNPEDISEIKIEIPLSLVQRIPTTRHASISGLTVCAIEAVKGELDFYHLHERSAVQEPAVISMQKRVKFIGRPEWQWMEHARHAIVTIEMRDGQRLSEEAWHVPMTRTELENKFQKLVLKKYGEVKTKSLKEALVNISSAESIKPLLQLLGG